MSQTSKKRGVGGASRAGPWHAPGALALVVATLGVLVLLGTLERYVWVGALVRELELHLWLATLLIAAFALARRAWLALGALVVMSAWLVWPLVPLYRTTRPTPQAGPVLRLAAAHLAGSALAPSVLAAYLARAQPDALALTGLARAVQLEPRIGSYRVARAAEGGPVLLVQSALVVPTRERAVGPRATVRAGRCQAHLTAVELPSLAAYTSLAARERAIAELMARATRARSIWLGHFGSRPEAHDLAAFVKAHALRDARLGHGRLASAPAALHGLGFPLSHVLVQGWISVRSMASEPPIAQGGHRTLHALLELTEPRCRFSRATGIE